MSRTEKITIVNKLGLHTRAASKLVNCASRYSSEIHLTKDKKTVDAKRIIQVMQLGASSGTKLTLTAKGEDEEKALQAIAKLIEDRFGESE